MQHHATAALDVPATVGVGRLAVDRIIRDRALRPSADTNTPLRPPKTSPIACI
jgi:hypothetical protein